MQGAISPEALAWITQRVVRLSPERRTRFLNDIAVSQPAIHASLQNYVADLKNSVGSTCSTDARGWPYLQQVSGYVLGKEETVQSGNDQDRVCHDLGRALGGENPSSTFTYDTTEALPALRLDWRNFAQRELERIRPPDCSIDGVLNVDRMLGEGSYGRVYMARLTRDPTGYPLAYKVPLPNAPAVNKRDTDAEREAFRWTNEQVRSGRSPNFILLYGECVGQAPAAVAGTSPVLDYVITEFADGDLEHLLDGRAPIYPPLLASLALQSMMAIFNMSYGDLVHNDLYLRNVLYKRITPAEARFRYRLPNVSAAAGPDFFLTFPSLGHLAEVSDLGLVSGSGGVSHQSRSRAQDAPNILVSQHVLETRLYPYGRDLYAFFHNLYIATLRMQTTTSSPLESQIGAIVGPPGSMANTAVGMWIRSSFDAIAAAADPLADPRGFPLPDSPAGLRALIEALLQTPEAHAAFDSDAFRLPANPDIFTFDLTGSS